MKITNAYQAILAKLGGNQDVNIPAPRNKYEKLLGDIPAGGGEGSSNDRLVVIISEDDNEDLVSSVSYAELVAAIDAKTDIIVHFAYTDTLPSDTGVVIYAEYNETSVYLRVSESAVVSQQAGVGPVRLGSDYKVMWYSTDYTISVDGSVELVHRLCNSDMLAITIPFTLSGSTATFQMSLREIVTLLAQGSSACFCTHKNDDLSAYSNTLWYEFTPVYWVCSESGLSSNWRYVLFLQHIRIENDIMNVETVTMSGTGNAGANVKTGAYSSKSYILTSANQ